MYCLIRSELKVDVLPYKVRTTSRCIALCICLGQNYK